MFVQKATDAWERFSDQGDELYLDAVAFNLQNFYQYLEKIFFAIAAQMDQNVPEGEGWEKTLLWQMAAETNELRMGVISKELALEFDAYRQFRHLADQSYSWQLPKEKLKKLAVAFPQNFHRLQKEITTFLTALEKQALGVG